MYDLWWRPKHQDPAVKEGTFESIDAMMRHILETENRFTGLWEGHDVTRVHLQATVLSISFI